MNGVRRFESGLSAPTMPGTDLSSVPPVGPPLVPSYQDFKPASAWNDPPTVLMKLPKTSPARVSGL